MIVVEIGSKQYLVMPGQKIIVDRQKGEVDTHIHLPVVYAFGEFGAVTSVEAKILSHHRGEKQIIAKYKPKSNYRRRYGYRSEETILQILADTTQHPKKTEKAKPATKKKVTKQTRSKKVA